MRGLKMLKSVGAAAALGLAALPAAASGPNNTVCAQAITIDGVVRQHSSSAGAPDVFGDCVAARNPLWFSFTAPEAGNYLVNTFGTQSLDQTSGFDSDTVLYIFDACGGTSLACNDDARGLDSAATLFLNAGQTIKIAVGEFEGDEFTFFLEVRRQNFDCADALWNNGEYNGNGAQTSTVGFNDQWDSVGLVTFDDFYLCEGRVHRVERIRGIMCTDAVIPKASVLLFRDCDGLPQASLRSTIAGASQIASLDQSLTDVLGECPKGRIEIRETGLVNADGLRIIEVIATFDRLWLDGGNYWVTFIGTSGTSNPLEQFFWGFAGENNVVKGRPGVFFNAETETFTDVDSLCCGCTDFAFTVEGYHCKVLLDNADPISPVNGLNNIALFPGTPSLQNGTRTSDKSRSADDIVFPPCAFGQFCYVRAYIWSNCDRVFLETYGNDCRKPGDGPNFTIEAACVTDTGIRTREPGSNIELKLLKAEFYDNWPKLRGLSGVNVWLSVFGQGDNRQNARAYFAFGRPCDTKCSINFNHGHSRGPAFATSQWLPADYDYALLVAIENNAVVRQPAVQVSACPADRNADGNVTVQDLFDFLAAWFAGCP